MGVKEHIGRRIQAIRNARGLSQGELAERIDRTTAVVFNLETGRSLPKFETLERLSTALEVPVGDFFGWDDPEKENPKRAANMALLIDAARSMSDEELETAVGVVHVLADKKD